jgi:hypothetical protein
MHGKRAEQDGDVCGRVAWIVRLETAWPWVLDDVLALVLVGPAWQQLRDQFDPLFPGVAA